LEDLPDPHLQTPFSRFVATCIDGSRLFLDSFEADKITARIMCSWLTLVPMDKDILAVLRTLSEYEKDKDEQLASGREPQGVYADFFSGPPKPERYKLQPAMEQSPDRIVRIGDLGELTSEQLADFILEHLTEYYLEHKKPN
jgi:hypothetical protein